MALYNATLAEGEEPADSAGIYAEQEPVSENAMFAARELGAELRGYRSKPVTETLLKQASHIFCMTGQHLQLLETQYPEFRDKYRMLAPRDIPDPYGGSLNDYRFCAAILQCAVIRIRKEASDV